MYEFSKEHDMNKDLIRQMMDNIAADNNAAAQEDFNNLMGARINDVLDQRKLAVAQSLSQPAETE
jgi:hypothetical protein